MFKTTQKPSLTVIETEPKFFPQLSVYEFGKSGRQAALATPVRPRPRREPQRLVARAKELPRSPVAGPPFHRPLIQPDR